MERKKEIFHVRPRSIEYIYYLDDEVTCTSDYPNLFEILSSTTEQDVVRIFIANYGGSLTTCVAIVNAIRQCKAQVIGVLTSIAYSAAGAIFLACDGHEVQNHTSFMGHDAIGENFGSLSQMSQSIEHKRDILRSLYNDVYRGFLTDGEIEELIQGKSDLWLREDDINERLSVKHSLLQEEYDQQMKEDSFDSKSLSKMTKKDLIEIITGN